MFDIKLFTITKDAGMTVLSAEASTLRFRVGFFPQEIVINNPQTGNTVKFKKAYSDVDDEGDLKSWTYWNHGSSMKKVRVKIFND